MEQTIQKNNCAVMKKTRELGVEILRILAMFFIVCQHFLNHGGFYDNAQGNKIFLNLVNVLFAPAVNVFVLISGYFSVRSTKFRARKTCLLWLQVLFYSLACIPLAKLLGAEIDAKYVRQSFLPVIHNKYWFFTTYFVMCFITPLLAKLIESLSKREHFAVVFGVFLVGYLSTRFDIGTVFSLNGGYGVFWFIMLFFIGAFLKKYPLKINKSILAVVYAIMIGLQLLFKYKMNDTSKLLVKLVYNSTGYLQPLTLLASVCLLLLFLGIETHGGWFGKLLTYLSSCTFGVYLFHEEPAIRSVLYNLFHTQAYWSSSFSVLIVLAFSAITFACGVAIESVRKEIFVLITKTFSRIKNKKERE